MRMRKPHALNHAARLPTLQGMSSRSTFSAPFVPAFVAPRTSRQSLTSVARLCQQYQQSQQ